MPLSKPLPPTGPLGLFFFRVCSLLFLWAIRWLFSLVSRWLFFCFFASCFSWLLAGLAVLFAAFARGCYADVLRIVVSKTRHFYYHHIKSSCHQMPSLLSIQLSRNIWLFYEQFSKLSARIAFPGRQKTGARAICSIVSGASGFHRKPDYSMSNVVFFLWILWVFCLVTRCVRSRMLCGCSADSRDAISQALLPCTFE